MARESCFDKLLAWRAMDGKPGWMRGLAGAASIVASTLLLAACGGSSAKDQIVHIIKAYGVQPTKLCTQYADAFMIRTQFQSKARCLAAARSPGAADPRVKVDSVSVKGNSAVAVRTSGSNPGQGMKATVYLFKEHGTWKVDSVVPRSS